MRKYGETRYVSPHKVVINWGCSELPERFSRCIVVNKPESVSIASNKLSFFNTASLRASQGLTAPRVPEHTESLEEALGWVSEGNTVFARTLLRANSGRGIQVMRNLDDRFVAPLYTKYVKKNSEYRVHVIGGEVVQVDRKARRLNVPDGQVNWQIRNLNGGFIFERDVGAPEDVSRQAIYAVQMCGLDFGAVDVIFNTHYDLAYVLEVNTAPGLEGITLENYAQNFLRRYANVRNYRTQT